MAKVVAILVAIVGAGVLIGFLATRPAGPPARPIEPSVPAATVSTTAAPVVPVVKEPFLANHYGALTGSAADLAAPVPMRGPLVTNWQERLDKVLESEVDEAVKARQLLEVFPNLPEEGQEEYAQHLSNLVVDEDYGLLAQHLTNSALPEAVLDVLISDALNRPNRMKLPTLLNVARDPRHPKAAEAKDLLELYLEEDYGADWATWEGKLNQWLNDNPD